MKKSLIAFVGVLIIIISIQLVGSKESEVSHKTILSCSAFKGLDELVTRDCVEYDNNGNFSIKSEIHKRMKFNKYGLVEVSILGNGCFWYSKEGVLMKTHCYDNGSDYFSEELSRHLDKKGKFGFLNKELKVIITPQYDFATPFKSGVAKVCMGCKSEKASPDDEHTMMKGGLWYLINKKGEIIKDCKNARTSMECN